MNEIKIYENAEFGQVRTQLDEAGQVWFCASDVCNILGYANSRKALSDHVNVSDVTKSYSTHTNSKGGSFFLFINESGLYSLIMGSKMPKAKEFKHWVTSEVLPSVRETGVYMTGDALERFMTDPNTILQIATNWRDERNARLLAEEKNLALEQKNQALTHQIEDDQPLVLFAKTVSSSNDDILIGELAKILRQSGIDIGEKRLFMWLRENGYLGKHGEYYNIPTQRAMDMGLFKIKKSSICLPSGETKVRSTTKVTGKGQIYFANRFLNNSTLQ